MRQIGLLLFALLALIACSGSSAGQPPPESGDQPNEGADAGPEETDAAPEEPPVLEVEGEMCLEPPPEEVDPEPCDE